MRRLIVLIFIIVSTLCFFTGFVPNQQTISQEEADALMKIYQEDMKDYRSFSLMPGTTELMDLREGPHGGYMTVYVNQIALDAMKANAEKLPDGSLIIKDIYNGSTKKFHAIALMKKMGGDWHLGGFWPPGKPNKFGKTHESSAGSCVKCHSLAKRDGVYLWK